MIPLGLGPLAVAEQQSAAAAKPEPSLPARAVDARDESTAEATADDGAEQDEAKEPAEAEAAASGVTPDAVEPVDFSGLYAGEDVAVFRLTGLPEREQKDENAEIRIESDSDTRIRITLVNSEDGSDLCELAATVTGNRAEIQPHQPCFTPQGQSAVSAELTSGSATLKDKLLTLEAKGSLSVTIADEPLSGDLDYSFSGSRQ
jgi:hypothetical protein